MKKGMTPVVVALVLGVVVILVIGLGGFGKLRSMANDAFEKMQRAISGEQEDETTTTQTTLYTSRAVGNRAEVLERVVSELNTCWLQMKRGSIQNHKCTTIDVAYTGEDNIEPPRSFVSASPQEARGPLHRTEIINALKLREEDAATQLNDEWGKPEEQTLNPWLYKGKYLICADYDTADPSGDDLWLTKSLNFECE